MACMLLLGPAGSGKTTLARALAIHLARSPACRRVVTCNLDPGTLDDEPWDVDVRTRFTTRQVMETHGLGPNGAISKSYELLAGCIDDILDGIDASGSDHLTIIDTPGQLDPLIFSGVGNVVFDGLRRKFHDITAIFLLPADVMNDAPAHAFLVLILSGLAIKLAVPVVHVIAKADLLTPAARARIEEPSLLERDAIAGSRGEVTEFSARAAGIASQLLPAIHPVYLDLAGGNRNGLADLLDLLDELGCACGDLS